MRDTLKSVLWFGLSAGWVCFAVMIMAAYKQGLTKSGGAAAQAVSPLVATTYDNKEKKQKNIKEPLDIWSIYIIMEE